jgi:hypothetical protein
MEYEALSRAYKVYFPHTGKLRVYRDVIFNEAPLLANLKMRHTLLPAELEEWHEEAAHEHPVPTVPAPVRPNPPSASFPDKHDMSLSQPLPPLSRTTARSSVERRRS